MLKLLLILVMTAQDGTSLTSGKDGRSGPESAPVTGSLAGQAADRGLARISTNGDPELKGADAAADPIDETRVTLQQAKMVATHQPRASLVAREAFLCRPDIVDVRLAPDGRHLSFLQRSDRGVDLMLEDVSSSARTQIAAGLRNAETAWSGDGRRLWLADDQGLATIELDESGRLSPKRILKWNPRRSQRLWAVDARAPLYAIIYERVPQADSSPESVSHDSAQHPALRPGYSGAALTERHRYLRVDPQGKTSLLLEAAWPLLSALLNADGDLAFTAAFDGPRYETAIRRHTAAGPRELLRCSTLEECRLVGYSEGDAAASHARHTPAPRAPQTLWLLSQHGEDTLALRRWRQDRGQWVTVHRDPAHVADADVLLWSTAREHWLAIAYHDGRRRWYGNDRGTRAVLTALERQLPEANLQLSATTDGRLWLVRAQQGDRALDRYYLYRPEQNRLQALFLRDDAARKSPPPGVAMHPICWRASDGRLLHGYVLLPGGIAPGEAPLIAWLHGGPVTCLYDEYDASLQLLVNRGYAVFVPNFRGSTGYGLRYVLSANGDVGNGRVLADIIDGLDFLLAQGIGDRDRQAVMGVSFGGYASLLALSHRPSRFRFAFAGAPPTEYGWIKQWQAENDSDALRAGAAPLSLQFPLMGFRYNDAAWRERMHRESPLAALPALQAPAYIWAGARDDHVPLKSIVQYAGEARRLGKPISLLIDPDAGHRPVSELGAEACLYLIENAAHRHFGGELLPVSPELRAFLHKNLRIDIDSHAERQRRS